MDKCLPFFKTLKKAFEWTDKCQKAFEELEAYLASPLLLSPSKPSEELSLYLACLQRPSAQLLFKKKIAYSYSSTTPTEHCKEWKEVTPPPMEKLAFTLITATRKTQVVLPSTHHSGPDGQAIAKGDEQYRGSWTNGFVGNRAQRVRHTIPTKSCDQGPGLS